MSLLLIRPEYLIRRRNFRWWSKFNYILSSSLDSGSFLSLELYFRVPVTNLRLRIGTTIGLIVIFLTLQLPKGGTIAINWWGNTVMDNSA